jgi:hypothetical protein
MKQTQRTLKEHPLGAHVLSVMENGKPQDSITLTECLAGCSCLFLTSPLFKAYRRVAQDILDNLEKPGLIKRSEYGWYTKK